MHMQHVCRALELGGETMSRVHDSRLYKSLLPLVGPLTEPAVKRILESPTFQVRSCKGSEMAPNLWIVSSTIQRSICDTAFSR